MSFALGDVFADTVTMDPDGTPDTGDEFQAGRLANNGGPVETIALNGIASNPALDAGKRADGSRSRHRRGR